MKTSENGLAIIKKFEGYSAKAYLDSVMIPTIGWGSIRWLDGTWVKIGQTISQEVAQVLLEAYVSKFEGTVNKLTLNQNQYDALVSFTYNVGPVAAANSTLFRKAKVNPCDPTIRSEFMKWNKAGGKVIKGLTNRRTMEADLYFKL